MTRDSAPQPTPPDGGAGGWAAVAGPAAAGSTPTRLPRTHRDRLRRLEPTLHPLPWQTPSPRPGPGRNRPVPPVGRPDRQRPGPGPRVRPRCPRLPLPRGASPRPGRIAVPPPAAPARPGAPAPPRWDNSSPTWPWPGTSRPARKTRRSTPGCSCPSRYWRSTWAASTRCGLLVTEENEHLIPEQDLQAWHAAVARYHARNPPHPEG